MCILIPLRTLIMSGKRWSLSCSISVLNADKDLSHGWLFFQGKVPSRQVWGSQHRAAAFQTAFQCPAGELRQDLEAEPWLWHLGVFQHCRCVPWHWFVPACARRATVLLQESRP